MKSELKWNLQWNLQLKWKQQMKWKLWWRYQLNGPARKNCDEIITELTCKEAEMIYAMAVATQVKSTVNENYPWYSSTQNQIYIGKQEWQIKWNLCWEYQLEQNMKWSLWYKQQLKNQNPCLKVASEIEICNWNDINNATKSNLQCK